MSMSYDEYSNKVKEITGLTPGASYNVKVVATTMSNEKLRQSSVVSQTSKAGIMDYDAPVWSGAAGVSNVSIVNKNTIEVSFGNVTDSSYPVFFKVWVEDVESFDASTSLPTKIFRSNDGNGGSVRISGLDSKKTYWALARAKDSSGNEDYNMSKFSVNLKAQDDTAPMFNNISTRIGSETGFVDLNWKNANDNLSANTQIIYNIYANQWDTLPIFSTMTDSTPTFLFKFGDTMQRELFIRAEDEFGNVSFDSSAIMISSKDNMPPATPSNLVYRNIGSHQIALSWNGVVDNSKEPVVYNIYEYNGSYTLLGKSYSTTYIHKFNAYVGTAYFAVSAVDFVGNESPKTSNITVNLIPEADVVDSAPPIFSGIEDVISGSIDNSVILNFIKPNDTGLVYLDVYRSNPNGLISDSMIFVNTINYNPLTDTSLEAKMNVVVTGLSGGNGDTYQFIVKARDNSGNIDVNKEVTSTQISNVNSVVHHFDIGSQYNISSLPVGKDISFTIYAKNSSNLNVDAFNGKVSIKISESQGVIYNSWYSDKFLENDILYVNLVNGIGYFSLNNSEKEQLAVNITMGNISNGFNFVFVPRNAGTTSTTQLALYADQTEFNANSSINVKVFALNTDGMINSSFTQSLNVDFAVVESGMNDYSVKINDNSMPGNKLTLSLNFQNGEAGIVLSDPISGGMTYEDITLSASASGVAPSNVLSLKALLNSINDVAVAGAGGVGSEINKTSYGTRIQMKLLSGYYNGSSLELYSYFNGIVNALITEDPNGNNSARIIDKQVKFANGIGELTVDNIDREMIKINLSANIPGVITLNKDFYVTFASVDNVTPKLVKAYAENPYLIHLEFSEALDPVNVFRTANYSGISQRIHTVCYYSDEVTLHLSSPLPLGKSLTISVNNEGSDGIRDKAGNLLDNGSKSITFTTPNVDLIGARASDEHFALEMPAKVKAGQSVTFRVVAKHMNACGFLSGNNSINAKHKLSTAKVTVSGVAGATVDRSVIDFNDGKAEFNVTVPGSSTNGQTLTVKVDDGVIVGAQQSQVSDIVP